MLVVGAGSMSGLAAATAARSGAASITVANRTRKHAERLAASVSTVTTTVTGLACSILLSASFSMKLTAWVDAAEKNLEAWDARRQRGST